MIEAAYPLLYARDVTEPEIAAGLEFLEERRAAFLAEELEADGEAEEEVEEGEPAEGEHAEPDTPEHRASMQAWIQYARALFSVAEFRFVD